MTGETLFAIWALGAAAIFVLAIVSAVLEPTRGGPTIIIWGGIGFGLLWPVSGLLLALTACVALIILNSERPMADPFAWKGD